MATKEEIIQRAMGEETPMDKTIADYAWGIGMGAFLVLVLFTAIAAGAYLLLPLLWILERDFLRAIRGYQQWIEVRNSIANLRKNLRPDSRVDPSILGQVSDLADLTENYYNALAERKYH